MTLSLPAVVISTSGRIHGEFLRFLYILAHQQRRSVQVPPSSSAQSQPRPFLTSKCRCSLAARARPHLRPSWMRKLQWKFSLRRRTTCCVTGSISRADAGLIAIALDTSQCLTDVPLVHVRQPVGGAGRTFQLHNESRSRRLELAHLDVGNDAALDSPRPPHLSEETPMLKVPAQRRQVVRGGLHRVFNVFERERDDVAFRGLPGIHQMASL